MSLISQSFPPKPKWWQKEIPDLTGKVMIVTGGKTEIGKETVKKATGKKALFLELDLASLGSVEKAADDLLTRKRELHVLFNDA
ncbi:hypothetical protein DFH09DRAFT_1252869 [Mycena vulgaris]|nr:hypothetical protein DFH09DRAFT_1252869 [Mycena vulgaris]